MPTMSIQVGFRPVAVGMDHAFLALTYDGAIIVSETFNSKRVNTRENNKYGISYIPFVHIVGCN